MTSRPSLLLAAALCALAPAAPADEPRRAPLPAEQQAREEKRLSDEDAEVVRQLAVLEQVDLLRNLDLFEAKAADAQAHQQPDAGPPQRD